MDKIENSDFGSFKKGYDVKTFEKIKGGNRLLREGFIRDHDQFICLVVGKVIGKTVIEKNSDEYKVGISAFDYAINIYEKKDYDEFLEFCERIIIEWLTDYKNQDKSILREEIVLLKNKMWEFGVTLDDLIIGTPKGKSTIRSCITFARELVVSEPVFRNFNLRKKLTDGESENIKRVFSRRIKKNKKYVIAVILILLSNLETLKNYLRNAQSENNIIEKIGTVLEYSREKVVFITEHGRFIMSDSLKDYYIGQRIYINDKKGIKRKIIRFSITAASVLSAVLIFYTGFNYVCANFDIDRIFGSRQVAVNTDLNKYKNEEAVYSTSTIGDNKKNTPEVSPENTPVVDRVEIVKNNNTNPESETLVVVDSVKPAYLNTQIPDKPAENKASIPAKIQRTAEKIRNTPVPKHLTKPALKSNPTSVNVKISPSKKPSQIPVPTGYPTVKATGVPGTPRIKADIYDTNVGQDYTIIMYMNGGNNGTKWVLYENGAEVATVHYTDNSPNEQSIMRLFTAKKPGSYKYKCELINSFGTSVSPEITVDVR